MPHTFTWSRRVDFADTDTAGVVHFSAYFRYMEEAEHAFYRSLGGEAYTRGEQETIGMPRVSARCDYRRPLRYGDTVSVRLTVREKTARSIGYEAEFLRAPEEEPVARGSMTVVYAVRPHDAREWKAAELPEPLRSAVEVAPD